MPETSAGLRAPLRRRLVRPSRAAVAVTLLISLLLPAPAAWSARINDVIDGFERTAEQPVDVSATTSFELRVKQGHLLREFRCLAHDKAGLGGFCSDGSKIMDAKELEVERNTQILNLDFELALWRVASFRLNLPIVLLDQTEIRYASGVNDQNTSVDPAGGFPPPSLFTVPFVGQKRSGLADPTLGVRFAPLSAARDRTRPTWSVDFDLTIPRLGDGAIKRASNESVGEGTWVFNFATALSARPRKWVEPYFEAGMHLRFPSANSLFQDLGPTQTLVSPGHGMHTTFGVEFIPWEDRLAERSIAIDVGGGLEYRFEGREYTELFEAFGSSTCDPRSATEPCDLTTYDRGDLEEGSSSRRKTDGITDVEQYALLDSWFGILYQPIRNVRIGAHFQVAYEMPHFLTFADAGRDLDGKNQVERENSNEQNEFNPVYDDAIDSLGTRFRSGGMQTYGFVFSLQGKF